MRLCPKHWDMLRAALKTLGLDKLGPQTGEEMIGDRLRELTTGQKPEFDPVMKSITMMYHYAIDQCGEEPLADKEACPVCVALSLNIGDEAYWIEGPAKAVHEYAEAKGFLAQH